MHHLSTEVTSNLPHHRATTEHLLHVINFSKVCCRFNTISEWTLARKVPCSPTGYRNNVKLACLLAGLLACFWGFADAEPPLNCCESEQQFFTIFSVATARKMMGSADWKLTIVVLLLSLTSTCLRRCAAVDTLSSINIHVRTTSSFRVL